MRLHIESRTQFTHKKTFRKWGNHICWCTSVSITRKILVKSFGAKECLLRKCFLLDDEEFLCLSTHWWRWWLVRSIVSLWTTMGCTVVWIVMYFHCFNSYHSLDNDQGTFETPSFSVDFYRKNLRTGGIIISFFFTKSRSNSQAPEDVLPACQTTLKNLQLKYLDLYLVSHGTH